MARDLRIRVRTIGADSVRSALRRIAQDTAAATGRQRQATRTRVSDERQAAREIERTHARMEANRVRETERSARTRARTEERAARQARQAQERELARSQQQRSVARRALPGAVGAALVAGADAVVGRARGYQSSLGIQSRDQLVQGFVDRQERLIRLQANTGVDADSLQGTVSQAARGALTSQDDIVTALETAQARLVGGDTNLQFFVENIERLARASRAAGGTTEDWTVAVGQMQRQLGVSASDTEELIGAMVSAARAGAIEAGDFAQEFSGILSQYRSVRGEQGAGIGGAREFTAIAQALGQGGRGAAEVRTLMQNMLAGLSRPDTQRNIERSLGDRNIFDRNGALTISVADLVQRMSSDADFQSATRRQEIFGRDLQVNEAFTTLLNGARGGANPIGDLQQVNAAEGQGVIDQFFSTLEGSTAGSVLETRARTESQFAENGQSLVEHEARLAAALSDVETRFPLATEAVGMLRDAAATTAGAMATLNLAMGGSLFGGGAAAATAGAAATGGTGLLAAGATVLGGGALAGAGLVLGTAGTAGGDVAPEQVEAQRARRALFSDDSLGAVRSLDGGTRSEVVRRATVEAQGSGRTISADDIRRIADAVRAGAAQGTEQGTRRGAPDAGRSPSGSTR